MPTKEELLDAIQDLQAKTPTYSTCEKLATFYTLLSHMYPNETDTGYSYSAPMDVFNDFQGSEFREAIAGKNIDKVVDVLDEHMSMVQVLFPKEYKAVIDEIQK